MNQSKFVAIPCNLLKAREKSRAQVAIVFGFPSHWLINWREILKPTSKLIFDSHLKANSPGFKCDRNKGVLFALKTGRKETFNPAPRLTTLIHQVLWEDKEPTLYSQKVRHEVPGDVVWPGKGDNIIKPLPRCNTLHKWKGDTQMAMYLDQGWKSQMHHAPNTRLT